MTTAKQTPKKTHVVATFAGHPGVRRILSAADQDKIVGVKGAGKDDLVWAQGNGKLDVTDVHADVIAYLRGSDEFTVKDVEI